MCKEPRSDKTKIKACLKPIFNKNDPSNNTMKPFSTFKNTLKGNLPILCLALMLFVLKSKEHVFAGRTTLINHSVVASEIPYAPVTDTDCVTARALPIGMGPGARPLITVEVTPDTQGQKCLVTATNKGENAVAEVRIRLQIPSGKTLVTTQADQGSYDKNTGIWIVGTLEKGANSTMTITLKAE
ncbi:DUF11 domain-containing protein [Spirosoma sp. KCTC 42546]|uniref:DUF11 domain-containing protein n=1 Tax=Spirosoma sp. KCTC 42546 TaxID=2520506 RepID=UPI001157A856|nr:DUF11 domain-containing protein [Spirosoma sp. KCTC 42546]QDK82149.1 DUF11 domain-containing protein [Spirosoma sp. KCTC 42546]